MKIVKKFKIKTTSGTIYYYESNIDISLVKLAELFGDLRTFSGVPMVVKDQKNNEVIINTGQIEKIEEMP